ncbi:Hypothetical predicted protein, partial [Olea europaea subsp. europaea]
NHVGTSFIDREGLKKSEGGGGESHGMATLAHWRPVVAVPVTAPQLFGRPADLDPLPRFRRVRNLARPGRVTPPPASPLVLRCSMYCKVVMLYLLSKYKYDVKLKLKVFPNHFIRPPTSPIGTTTLATRILHFPYGVRGKWWPTRVFTQLQPSFSVREDRYPVVKE